MRKKAYFIAGFLILGFQLAPLVVAAQNVRAFRVAVETHDRNIQVINQIQQRLDDLNAAKQRIQLERESLQNTIQVVREELKNKREVLAEQVRTMRQKFQDYANVRRAELRKQLGDQRAERVEVFFNKMIVRLQAAIDRLKSLSDRISARLDKAAANGKDVTQLRDQLSKAKDKIAEAEKALEDAKLKYTEATRESNFRIAFKKVREAVQVATEKIKDAHRALVGVINSIKGLGGGSEHATTTRP